MAYTKQTWQDLPSKTTPINASRLGHIEQGIYDAASTADTAASDASSAISGLADKVDKVEGKGLSTNDFTDALKTKLDNIEAGAEVNVQADYAQTNTEADDYIKNKPSLGTSAYKNSTSVVTDSSDLVESGAVYTALQGKCDNSVIGTVEDGTTASQAYAVGSHFIRNGAFCTITTAISSGESLVGSSKFTSGDVASDLVYKAGNVVRLGFPSGGDNYLFGINGNISGGGRFLRFGVALDKPIIASSVAVTFSNTGSRYCRTIRGNVKGTMLSRATITNPAICGNYVYFTLTSTDPYVNDSDDPITNNTPIYMELYNQEIIFTFS